mmetsp:Transcript_25759/g.61353  ORF Transcript_25759/g.61353 Transcript_25759/m.61353 type:complete len:252 (-) Transcript_25759:105-860(-)
MSQTKSRLGALTSSSSLHPRSRSRSGGTPGPRSSTCRSSWAPRAAPGVSSSATCTRTPSPPAAAAARPRPAPRARSSSSAASGAPSRPGGAASAGAATRCSFPSRPRRCLRGGTGGRRCRGMRRRPSTSPWRSSRARRRSASSRWRTSAPSSNRRRRRRCPRCRLSSAASSRRRPSRPCPGRGSPSGTFSSSPWKTGQARSRRSDAEGSAADLSSVLGSSIEHSVGLVRNASTQAASWTPTPFMMGFLLTV